MIGKLEEKKIIYPQMKYKKHFVFDINIVFCFVLCIGGKFFGLELKNIFVKEYNEML